MAQWPQSIRRGGSGDIDPVHHHSSSFIGEEQTWRA
jgi:hypothetical protein